METALGCNYFSQTAEQKSSSKKKTKRLSMGFFLSSSKKRTAIQIFTTGGLMKDGGRQGGEVEIRNCIRQRVRGGTTTEVLGDERRTCASAKRSEERGLRGGRGWGRLGLRVLPNCPRGDE